MNVRYTIERLSLRLTADVPSHALRCKIPNIKLPQWNCEEVNLQAVGQRNLRWSLSRK